MKKSKEKEHISRARSAHLASERAERKKTKKKKVDVDVDLDDEPVKKKKKKSTDLVVVPSGKNQIVPLEKKKKKDKKAIETLFGAHSNTIIQMLEMNDSDGALTLIRKKVLQTTVDLVPMAEAILRESGSSRGIYQYVSLISTLRELMTDVEAAQDKKHLTTTLMEQVIRPALMNIAQAMITDHHSFKKEVESMLKPDKVQEFNSKMTQLARDLAGTAQRQYEDIRSKMQDALRT